MPRTNGRSVRLGNTITDLDGLEDLITLLISRQLIVTNILWSSTSPKCQVLPLLWTSSGKDLKKQASKTKKSNLNSIQVGKSSRRKMLKVIWQKLLMKWTTEQERKAATHSKFKKHGNQYLESMLGLSLMMEANIPYNTHLPFLPMLLLKSNKLPQVSMNQSLKCDRSFNPYYKL